MVEKIDRPEVAPTYQVVATTPAKDERGQSQQQPQPEDEFSSPGSRMEWEKIHGSLQERALVRFPREQIRQIGFRRATFTPRAIIVETDLELADGKLYRGAQFLIPHLDELTKWKGFLPGQAIPLTELVREATIEVSVPQRRATLPTPPAPVTPPAGTPQRRFTDERLFAMVAIGVMILIAVIVLFVL